MTRKLGARLSIAFLVCVLAAVQLVAGCGTSTTGGIQVLIGYQGDVTGPAMSSLVPVYDGMMDYIRKAEADGLLGDIKIRVISYDTRSDYSRVPIGYTNLKSRGAQAIIFPSPADIDIIKNNLEEDGIPAFGTTSLETSRDYEWAFFTFETMEFQNMGVMQWITDTWDYSKGKPRIGAMGWSGLSVTVGMMNALDEYVPLNSDKVDWAGAQIAPMGSTSWAVEAGRLVDCDFIMMGTVGSGTASFIKEARQRGYEGAFIGSNAPIAGFWDLVVSNVDADELYDCYHIHHMPWCLDCSFATEWQTLIASHPQAYVDKESRQSSYATGPMLGRWIVDIVNRAAAKVGPENIDGRALQEAASTTNLDLTSTGWGNVWDLSDNQICCKTQMMFKWDIATKSWGSISDWFLVD